MSPSRRGRPTTPTPIRTGRHGCEHYIAWMLRANRMFGVEEDLSKGSAFARAFTSADWPDELHPSRITRWERGDATVDYRVIRRYEELLHLPRHLLVSVADAAYREALGSAGPPLLRRPPSHGRKDLGDILDRALGEDPMDADGWDEITADLDAARILLPAADPRWATLAERLVTELSIAEDSAWLRRGEASVRLIGDRDNTAAVIASCAALAADPRNQMPAEPLTLLEISPHPDAARQVIRQISDPTSESARRGAWWSAAQKSHRPHLRPPERVAFVKHAGDLLAGYQGHPSCRMSAADVLRQLGARSPALLKRLGEDDAARSILTSGRVAAEDVTAPYVRRLTAEILAWMPREVFTEEPILSRLLSDVLFEARIDVQIMALRRIWATPYRFPTAKVLAGQLDSREVRDDETLTRAILAGLASLGTPAHRRMFEALAFSGRTSPNIRNACVWHLAHIAGTSSDRFWAELITRHVADRSDPLAEHTARGVVYALGVHRRFTELRALHADPTSPAVIKDAAFWWLNTPGHILRSTERQELVPSGL